MAVPGRHNLDGDDDEEGILFVEEGALPEPDFEDTPPHLRDLAAAAMHGDLDGLRQALDNLDDSIDEPVEDGDTALHLTCLYGHLSCVQLLLERGASVEAKDEDGGVPLHDACAGGFMEIAQLLIAKANSAECLKQMLESVDVEGDTPLHHAARGEHDQIVQLLLSIGASPTKTNVYGKTPGELAEQNTQTWTILEAAIWQSAMEAVVNGVNDKKQEKKILKLKCSVQNYDWGRIGYDSRVARLFEKNSRCGVGQIDEKKHYAEFWIGTHVSGPSFVQKHDGNYDENVSLKFWIMQNPKVLGDIVVDKWGLDLPFLLKVLSVGRSLSIQAHPDKELAGFLHKLQPNVYKDANHKPEMALALTEFEALCGFISAEELDVVLQNVPEIKEVVGNACADQISAMDKFNGEVKEVRVLRAIFTELMSVNREVISEALFKLVNRLSREKETRLLTSKEELVLKLEKQYPNDVGVFAALLLNQVKLEPGDALYIGANELHAYLKGECIECMAASDNVVRAGLTPKYMDVKILCSMLTYKQGLPEILKGVPVNPYVRRYTPPFEEFEVDRCMMDQGGLVVFPALPGPSVFVVISGEGSMHTDSSEDRVSEGDALFAPAGTEIHVSTDTKLHLYRAGVNNKVLMNS